MRRALALALAAVALLVPAATGADAAGHRGHRHAHKQRHAPKRHYRDERVVMPPRRTARKPPRKPPATTPEPTPLTRMKVVAREFSLTLSRQAVPAGTVAVELDNHGEDPHDLRVERAQNALAGFNFTLTKPGTFATRKLELGPGTWKLYCTLDGHEALGMSATLTVGG